MRTTLVFWYCWLAALRFFLIFLRLRDSFWSCWALASSWALTDFICSLRELILADFYSIFLFNFSISISCEQSRYTMLAYFFYFLISKSNIFFSLSSSYLLSKVSLSFSIEFFLSLNPFFKASSFFFNFSFLFDSLSLSIVSFEASSLLWGVIYLMSSFLSTFMFVPLFFGLGVTDNFPKLPCLDYFWFYIFILLFNNFILSICFLGDNGY